MKNTVAANWKMNLTRTEGLALTDAIVERLAQDADTRVILGVPFPFLADVAVRVRGAMNIHLAAQNCHQEEKGAFTAEVSAAMLRSFGTEYVILGHSERREYFEEDDALILAKMRKALEHGICPIYCCGERLEHRENEQHFNVVKQQLESSVLKLEASEVENILIAYEPVWAIGTGKTATPEQAEEMHRFIRQQLSSRFGEKVAAAIPLLYGGSVKPGNAAELFAKPNINGGLIGGASLVAEDFLAIVKG